MPYALLSVFDKAGLEGFASGLRSAGFNLLSSGGTAEFLRSRGTEVKDVAELTEFPEILGGRVKTLHPKVHGGILFDRKKEDHVAATEDHGLPDIQVVAVNLYPFEESISREHTLGEAIENIDIGGPAMIRAAAKNHASVMVVVDPADYDEVLEAISTGNVTDALRTKLAAKAFRHTAYYDSLIARYLAREVGLSPFQNPLVLGLRMKEQLRYGENPHQQAAFFEDPLRQSSSLKQLWGVALSYNNLLDLFAAAGIVVDLGHSACAIVKHGNPCGCAIRSSGAEAYAEAKSADPISAFGGIAAFNVPVDEEAAQVMTEKNNFLEVVVAPEFDGRAVEVFKARQGWGQNVRLVQVPTGWRPRAQIRSAGSGFLLQETDKSLSSKNWQVATISAPTEEQWRDLEFAFQLCAHIKSNAIAVARGAALLGVGAGQMNRVQSVRLALEQAGEDANGAVLASDAFFPFPDSIEVAARHGISAIVQPGGSKKDEEVVAAADQLGLAMVFTGERHFLH
jgi:phosphoribosylaminoimidazolecarboxamide formyltransferase/IMP cyclohydrolase